jgi:hypothetical protein
MKRIGALILGVAAIAAIAAVLLTAGGPGEARREESDWTRYEDLRTMDRMLACSDDGAVAPDALPSEGTPYCGSTVVMAPMADPETEAAYVYSKTGATTYTLCATFHDGSRIVQGQTRSDFDPATGCLSGDITK